MLARGNNGRISARRYDGLPSPSGPGVATSHDACQNRAMAIGNPLLHFLWRDLLGLGEVAFTLLVFLFLPALVITLVSASRRRPVSWRTIGLAFLRAWLSGIVACLVFGLTLTGFIKLARQM